MLTVCSWDDVAYGIYNTSGRITSTYENGCDVYANTLDLYLSNANSCEETVSCVLGK